MIAKGAVGQLLARGDRSFEDDFAVAWHLQVQGFALRQSHALSGVETSKQPLAQLYGNRRGSSHHQEGVNPDRDGDLQRFTECGGLAQVARAPAHAQPMHRHGVDRLLLQPVDPDVGGPGFGILRDHQAEGDDAARITGPGPQQR